MTSEKFNLRKGESALKQIRDALKLSQEAFAREIGASLGTVGRWERGERTPTFTIPQMKALKKLLDQIGMPLEDLPENLGPEDENN